MILKNILSIKNLSLIQEGLIVSAPSALYYIMWHITGLRATNQYCQAAEFILMRNGETGYYENPRPIVDNPSGSNPLTEKPFNLVDNKASSKCLDFNFWTGNNSGHFTKFIFAFTGWTGAYGSFTGYRYVTANDASNRDPIRWDISGSPDGENWVHLDTRTGETITTIRFALTQSWPLTY